MEVPNCPPPLVLGTRHLDYPFRDPQSPPHTAQPPTPRSRKHLWAWPGACAQNKDGLTCFPPSLSPGGPELVSAVWVQWRGHWAPSGLVAGGRSSQAGLELWPVGHTLPTNVGSGLAPAQRPKAPVRGSGHARLLPGGPGRSCWEGAQGGGGGACDSAAACAEGPQPPTGGTWPAGAEGRVPGPPGCPGFVWRQKGKASLPRKHEDAWRRSGTSPLGIPLARGGDEACLSRPGVSWALPGPATLHTIPTTEWNWGCH